jgi:hypothetical protein
MVSAESNMYSLKEHFSFYWRMYHLMLIRGCGLSMMSPLPIFAMGIQLSALHGLPIITPFFLIGTYQRKYLSQKYKAAKT